MLSFYFFFLFKPTQKSVLRNIFYKVIKVTNLCEKKNSEPLFGCRVFSFDGNLDRLTVAVELRREVGKKMFHPSSDLFHCCCCLLFLLTLELLISVVVVVHLKKSFPAAHFVDLNHKIGFAILSSCHLNYT